MIAANIVNHTVGNTPNVAMNGAAPETAGFDFMNYLLGLQTSPLDLGTTAGNGPANVKAPTFLNGALLQGALAKTDADAGKSPKPELNPWNLIFPGMVPANAVDPRSVANPEGKPANALVAQAGLLNVNPNAATVP